MWRPDGWEEIIKQIAERDFMGYTAAKEIAEAGADAMHKTDVKWLKEHEYLYNLTQDGEIRVTIKVKGKDWLAFTGGGIV